MTSKRKSRPLVSSPTCKELGSHHIYPQNKKKELNKLKTNNLDPSENQGHRANICSKSGRDRHVETESQLARAETSPGTSAKVGKPKLN